jgi:hypothetical protein
MKISILLTAGLIGLAACASGGTPTARWSASAWDGLAGQTIGTDNYNFFAAPLDGQGFKLKLTLALDGNFGVQAGEATLAAELEEAARKAAPEGCTFLSLTRTEDGGAEAAYDCA